MVIHKCKPMSQICSAHCVIIMNLCIVILMSVSEMTEHHTFPLIPGLKKLKIIRDTTYFIQYVKDMGFPHVMKNCSICNTERERECSHHNDKWSLQNSIIYIYIWPFVVSSLPIFVKHLAPYVYIDIPNDMLVSTSAMQFC